MRFISRYSRRLGSSEVAFFKLLEYCSPSGCRCFILVISVWYGDDLEYLEFFSNNRSLLIRAVHEFGFFFGSRFLKRSSIIRLDEGFVYAFYDTVVVFQRALEAFQKDRAEFKRRVSGCE
ncbi:MAG: hypothetical protein DRJ52_08975 [Thermoprotei archaeon]|nr:MAG: hypothetical protein DRJ52_08975 [Thermoprotei archaeon]